MSDSDEEDIIKIKLTPKMRAFLDAVVVGREMRRRQVEAMWRQAQVEPSPEFPPGHPGGYLRPQMRRPGPPHDESDVAQYALDTGLTMLLHSLTGPAHAHGLVGHGPELPADFGAGGGAGGEELQ